MIGLVLITHGHLAQQFLAATEYVIGPQPQAEAIGMLPDDSVDSMRDQLLDTIAAVDDGAGVIILTDIFGAGPSNIALSVMGLTQAEVEVISGINLPLLVRLATVRLHHSLTDAVAEAQKSGQQSIHVTSHLLSTDKASWDRFRKTEAAGPAVLPRSSVQQAEDGRLERRTIPQQKRARERIAQILAATERLLVSHISEEITTTTVAAEAEIPVSSVYRYFPNIYSIYREMFEALSAETEMIVSSIITDTKTYPDWRHRHGAVIEALRASFNRHPAYRPLFLLMVTSRDLLPVKNAANARIASVLAEWWRQGSDGFSGGDPDMVARIVVEIFNGIEARVIESADAAMTDAYYRESLIAIQHYLSAYLRQQSESSPALPA